MKWEHGISKNHINPKKRKEKASTFFFFYIYTQHTNPHPTNKQKLKKNHCLDIFQHLLLKIHRKEKEKMTLFFEVMMIKKKFILYIYIYMKKKIQICNNMCLCHVYI